MRFCVLLLLLLATGSAHGLQDGDIDPAFGNAGFRFLDTAPIAGVPTNERGQYAARLADGRLLVGLQGQQNGAQRAITAVFSADGQLLIATRTFTEVDFSTGAIDPPIRGYGLDAAGALYIGGSTDEAGSTQVRVLKVLPPDYTALDPDWGAAGVATLRPLTTLSVLNALHVEPDGRVVVCGDGRLPDGPLLGFCTRLLADGSIDVSFGEAFFVINEAAVRMVLVQSITAAAGGDYLIAGQATLADGLRYNLVARLDAGGTLDTTFCSSCGGASVAFSAPGFRVDAGAVQFACPRIALRPDGEVVRVGIHYTAGGSMLVHRRYDGVSGTSLGGIAETFPGFTAHFGCDPRLAVQPDNQVLFAYTLRLAGVQYGSLVRFPAQPTLATPRDPQFAASAEFIRGALPSGLSAAGNECNYALLEPDGILCVGLARIADDPTNLDVMLARVRNGVPAEVFADGFE